MSGQTVADFVGRYAVNPKTGIHDEPATGRILMNKRQLVVASDDDQLTIPLSKVADVVVGNVPPDMRDLFDDTVTVGYQNDESVETVLIEASDDTIDRFVTVLFKCLLNGTEGIVKHPARIGGRVMDTSFVPTKLAVTSGSVRFKTPSERFEITPSSVVDFDWVERSPDGTARPTLVVKHTDGAEIQTSLLAPESHREVNLLSRYLRIEYGQLLSEVSDVSLSEAEKRVLVGIHTTGGDIDFGTILNGNAARATNVLNSLRKKELVKEDDIGVELTSSGRIVVNQRIEDVNT
jgi:helix-turn-helix protein